MGKNIMSGQRCGKRISISPLRSEYDPRDQQWLYVRGYGGRPLGHVGFLRLLWLPLNFIHRLDQKASSVSYTFQRVNTVNRFCFLRDRRAPPPATPLLNNRRKTPHPEEKLHHLFEIDCISYENTKFGFMAFSNIYQSWFSTMFHRI